MRVAKDWNMRHRSEYRQDAILQSQPDDNRRRSEVYRDVPEIAAQRSSSSDRGAQPRASCPRSRVTPRNQVQDIDLFDLEMRQPGGNQLLPDFIDGVSRMQRRRKVSF